MARVSGDKPTMKDFRARAPAFAFHLIEKKKHRIAITNIYLTAVTQLLPSINNKKLWSRSLNKCLRYNYNYDVYFKILSTQLAS